MWDYYWFSLLVAIKLVFMFICLWKQNPDANMCNPWCWWWIPNQCSLPVADWWWGSADSIDLPCFSQRYPLQLSSSFLKLAMWNDGLETNRKRRVLLTMMICWIWYASLIYKRLQNNAKMDSSFCDLYREPFRRSACAGTIWGIVHIFESKIFSYIFLKKIILKFL